LSLRGVLEGTNPVIARTKVLTKDFANANAASQAFGDRLDQVNGELTGVNATINNLIDTQKKLDAQDKKSAQTAQKNKNAAAAQAKRDAKKNETQQKKNIALRTEQIRVDNLFNATKRISDQAAINKQELKGFRQQTRFRRREEREANLFLQKGKDLLPTQISQIVPSLNNEKFLTSVRIANNELERLKKEANLSAAYNLISGTFFAPMEDLFSNFLETGKFAFKEFAQAILKAISQIVAKVIATGIITLLASLFIPGFSAAGGGLAATLLSGITGALGFGDGGPGGIGKVAAPSFAGVSGGPLNMAGAVNLSLRGSDLVGSINRTNATISRVG
jgi:hypothetical protein